MPRQPKPRSTSSVPRKSQSAPRPASKSSSHTGCDIKGNIADDGEKIYHVPGQQHYDITKISLKKGERWFCSEADAVEAGWRKAKV
ncbi:hypothetical protein [Luteipulveratus mongoliensis]|uniref:sunset domain-containing protein n=1 Tax=Luteipulveratus mongoliensis TaxID=571913 RepID=UPI0009F9BBCA|nr:hypothetical protein [Luteipulveratus mongoliensis]